MNSTQSAKITNETIKNIPQIENIHAAVFAAASAPFAFSMNAWHRCETTHCRAGWVVTLAGEAGAMLEREFGTPRAAELIYMASDPSLNFIPDFYCDDDEALADMRRLAEAEGK